MFIWDFIIHNRLIIFLGLHLGKSSKVARTNLVSLKGFSRGINLCLFGVFSFTIHFTKLLPVKIPTTIDKVKIIIHQIILCLFGILSFVIVLVVKTGLAQLSCSLDIKVTNKNMIHFCVFSGFSTEDAFIVFIWLFLFHKFDLWLSRPLFFPLLLSPSSLRHFSLLNTEERQHPFRLT